ncbi:carboxypeptidase-like regulatory domain-containing protein [Aureivirga sp. CE67]|uniref:carboxypeptidase-like regulatory domain-containing protein n=1 Tax=Aureivirga sp. CE67 TaxID=1788983 RepID=UPI001E60C500|nr:carboxypeptidase-like regulatory domain-containing protein [Aureivirga sp. CE67]
MKNRNETISVPNPCSEKFKNFTPTEKGGFCQSCQTEVIDFTNMSKEEILSYLKNRNEKVCGYFQKEQLDTNNSKIIPLEKKPRFKYAGAASIIGFSLLSFFNPNSVYAQKNTNKTHQVESKKQKEVKQTTKYTVKGIVSDEYEGLPSATVVLKNSTISTETDFDGNFEFPEKLKAGDILVFSFVGYRDFEYKIKRKEENETINLNIILEQEYIDAVIGKVATNNVYQSKPSFFQRVKNIFKRKEK